MGSSNSKPTLVETDRQYALQNSFTTTRGLDVTKIHQTSPRCRVELVTDCVVCTEPKSPLEFPIISVSSQCNHPPKTCLKCVATSIKTEFNTKQWNQIHCPECHALMDYQDVEEYADTRTFTKYQNMAFRAALGESPDFVWCPTNCGSGQIHDAAEDSPIVRCVKCAHKFCFRHHVAWHQQLTCDEYDNFLRDPENFRSRVDIANEEIEDQRLAERWQRQEQEEADRRFAQTLLEADQVAEAERQAKIEQAERKKREAAEMARLEAINKAAKEKSADMRRDAARKKADEEKSQLLVKKTTKPCPGCGWAIEKNEGCAHMTCIKCSHQFCWNCLGPWSGPHNGSCRG